MKRQATKWVKIFANHIYYNELHLERITNFQNNIKRKTSQLKIGKGIEQTLHQIVYMDGT